MGTSFFWVPLQTILSDATEYKYRSEAFGVYSQQIGMGVFFGATFGFFIFGWASGTGGGSALMYSPLLIYGVVNVYGGLRALKLAPMVPLLELPAEHTDSFTEHQEEDSNSFGDTLFWLSLIFLFAIVFLEQMIGSLVAPFLEVFLLKYISGDPMNIAIAYAPGAVLSFVLAPKMGKIADKINPRYWLASTSALGALTTWFLVNSTELWQFTMLFIVDSTVISSAGLVLSKIISDVSKTRRGSVFGTQGGVSNFGAIAGPVMGGILWELIGDRAPFLLSIGVEAFLAVVYLVSISYILTQLKGRTEEKRETPYVPPLLR
ncbi:MAG: MFS transporter [Candidatus Korarchaeota archaeon]|nr:MFS transporter [Candidatus Korarchaeota archaeon]